MSKAKAAASRTSTAGPKSQASQEPAAVLPLGFTSLFGLLSYATLCLLLLIAPYLFSGFWPADYTYWPQSLFLALTAVMYVFLALDPQSKLALRHSKPALLVALFVAWCTLTVAFTVYWHDSLLDIVRIWGMAAWFFAARAFLARREAFEARLTCLLAMVTAGIFWVCVLALMNYVDPDNPRRFDRQFGTFYNPNLFANYLAMALPLSVSLALLAWRTVRRKFSAGAGIAVATGMAAIVAFLALGLYLTSSKGGLLSALCALGVLAVGVMRARGGHAKQLLRQRRGLVIIVALVVVLGGGGLFAKRIAPRLSSKITSDHSTMFRAYTWGGTLRMANARPVQGWGPGSFPSAYPAFAQTGYTRTSHHLWLQLAAESGWSAMLLLLFGWGAGVAAAWRALQGRQWIAATGALGALAAFLVHGLMDAGWGITSIGALMMVVLAVASCDEIGQKEESPASAPAAKSALGWAWLISAIPLALGSWLYQQAQGGEDFRTESREQMLRGSKLQGLETAHMAVQTDSLSARLQSNLAQAQEAGGEDAATTYEKIRNLQPTRALNYLSYAEYKNRHPEKSGGPGIAELYDTAVRLDPNDTDIRLARGKWKLNRNDATGWEDIEHIAASARAPFGLYPAVPEMVDLNFASAYAMLAERDIRKNPAAARKWVDLGLAVIADGRKNEEERRKAEEAARGAVDSSREETMNRLEAEFKELKAKLP